MRAFIDSGRVSDLADLPPAVDRAMSSFVVMCWPAPLRLEADDTVDAFVEMDDALDWPERLPLWLPGWCCTCGADEARLSCLSCGVA